jgi:hypothetical protein
MATLELVKGSAAGTRYELDGDRAVIGRSADCEVPLDVPAVSRRHAAILRDRGHYFVEDLQSRNGTFLNDTRVTDRAPLGEGDRLVICDQEFRFYTGDGTGMLSPYRNLEESSIVQLVDDETTPGRASVMATFDVSGGSASWGLSAKPEVKLAALMEITNALAQTLAVEDILPKVLDSLFKIFTQADRGFVVMKPRPETPPVVMADKARRPGGETQMRISRTIVEVAMKSR